MLCNLARRYQLTRGTNQNVFDFQEKEKLIENEKKISVFLKPLTKVIIDLKKKPNASHSLKDLSLLRYKMMDLIFTINYVVSIIPRYIRIVMSVRLGRTI
jgi:DNA-binding transcriptional regulator YhcF (GntR family)